MVADLDITIKISGNSWVNAEKLWTELCHSINMFSYLAPLFLFLYLNNNMYSIILNITDPFLLTYQERAWKTKLQSTVEVQGKTEK
jgi:hypothetical protein